LSLHVDEGLRALRVERDGASKLPSLPSILHDVRVLLATHGYLGVILVDLEPLHAIEAECGSDTYNELIARIGSEIDQMRGEVIRSSDVVCSVRSYGEQIAIFLDGARHVRALSVGEIESLSERAYIAIAGRVFQLTRPYGSAAQVRLGHALILPNAMIQPERLIYRALDQARIIAADNARRLDTRARERLRDLIVNRELSTVFQPILHMPDGQVQGYEALIRGPAGSELANPAMLFGLAHHTQLVSELDRACCEVTVSTAATMPQDALLFANVVPPLVNDAAFRRWLLDKAQALGPQRVVLELNEGYAIRNYPLLEQGLKELRKEGVRVAVDDLGTGHANLDHVLRIQPDFLKLDISLIRGVDTSEVKQAIVSSLVSVGAAVNATLIAEGIEQPGEHQKLLELGVRWGQGFLLGRPAPGFQASKPPVTQ
jgi:EAL domain-containing protein (putative c-di-GMP-specific phosphodiesterase class I)